MVKTKGRTTLKDALISILLVTNIIFIIMLYQKADAKAESVKEAFDMDVSFLSDVPTEKLNVLTLSAPKAEAPTANYGDLEKMTVVATAYCPCEKCCGKTDGITSTGTKATAGRTVAVDPRKIPYGTKIYIDGHEYIAEDCGGAIKDNRIDIYFDTHSEALQFGRKTLEIEIERAENAS